VNLRHHDYPSAVTCSGSKYPERAQVAGIRWVVEQLDAVGGQILLYVHKKSDIKRADHHIEKLSKVPGVVVGSWQSMGAWSGGPVLAAWPSRKKLAEIADDPRVRALCVIPWADGETDAWQIAADPERLSGAEPVHNAADATLDPVVKVALEHLSAMVNHANQLAGALDHRDAVAVLRILHKGGYRLPREAVYAWALANDWPARGAERLRELAGKIDDGRTVQMKGGSPFRPDVLSSWRAEADEADK
jgi:hypothetical protein